MESQTQTQTAAPRPLGVFLRALVGRNPLVPLQPAWLEPSSPQTRGGALLIKGNFWLPIKTVRYVAPEILPSASATMSKVTTIVSGLLMLNSIIGMGQLIELFKWFESAHMALNLFIIALFPVFIATIIKLTRDMRFSKILPIADLNEESKRDVTLINIGFWAFTLITLLATAIIEFAKGVSGSQGQKPVEVAAAAADEVAENAPNMAAEAIAAQIGDVSIAGALGFTLLRIVSGTAVSFGATVLVLGIFTLVIDTPALFIGTAVAAYALVIFMTVLVFRRHRDIKPVTADDIANLKQDFEPVPSVARTPVPVKPRRKMTQILRERWRLAAGVSAAAIALTVFLVWPTSVTYIEVTPYSSDLRPSDNVKLYSWPVFGSNWRRRPNVYGADRFWSSSDTSVARVDSNGNVTAVGPGTATISAKMVGVSGYAQVTVEAFDVPPIKAFVGHMKLYEADYEGINVAQRQYVSIFDSSTTRYIWSELLLKHESLDKGAEGTINCSYVDAEGSQRQFDISLRFADPTRDSSYLASGYGSRGGGSFSPGFYDAVCLYDGTEIARTRFEVVPDSFRSADGLLQVVLPSRLYLQGTQQNPSAYFFSSNSGFPQVLITVNRYPTSAMWDPLHKKEPLVQMMVQTVQQILGMSKGLQGQSVEYSADRTFSAHGTIENKETSYPAAFRARLGDNFAVNVFVVEGEGGDPIAVIDRIVSSLRIDTQSLQTPQTQSEISQIVRDTLEQMSLVWGPDWSPQLGWLQIRSSGTGEALSLSLQYSNSGIEKAIAFVKNAISSTTLYGGPSPSVYGLTDQQASAGTQAIYRVAGFLAAMSLSTSRPIGKVSMYVLVPDGRQIATITMSPERFANALIQGFEGNPSAMQRAISIE